MTVVKRRSTGPHWDTIVYLLVGAAFVLGAMWLTHSANDTERLIEGLIMILVALGVAKVGGGGGPTPPAGG